jgi:hypothetical protein
VFLNQAFVFGVKIFVGARFPQLFLVSLYLVIRLHPGSGSSNFGVKKWQR